MAFRALLFSKSLDTNAALTAACQNAGIRLEICDDIFSAIEKGTHQPFSCVLADWSEQPEAGFLLKRARESAPNVNAVAIAIVTHEPTAANMRENRLDFFISRPIVAEQAQEVLVKAAEGMQEVSIADLPEIRTPAPRPDQPSRSAPAAVPPAQNPERNQWQNPAEPVQTSTVYDGGMDVTEDSAAITRQQHRNHSSGSSFSWRGAAAAVLALVAIFCLWTARGTIQYLARTSESRANVFKEAAEALFSPNVPAATPAPSDAAIDAYVNRSESKSEGHVQLGVVSTEAEVDNSQLRKPSELPLPAPVYEHPAATPIEAPRTSIPESLRSSASMPPPVVVTTTPAQMMPVSAPGRGSVLHATIQRTGGRDGRGRTIPACPERDTRISAGSGRAKDARRRGSASHDCPRRNGGRPEDCSRIFCALKSRDCGGEAVAVSTLRDQRSPRRDADLHYCQLQRAHKLRLPIKCGANFP